MNILVYLSFMGKLGNFFLFLIVFTDWLTDQMETVIYRMLDDVDGVPIKTVKSFLSKIPSVFTGADLVTWLMTHVPVSDIC